MRIGHGYDAHQIISGSGMVLGGVEIKCDYSIEAHSDGDIIVHSLIDALLGAAAYGDLGTFFPSSDENLKGISSFSMLSTVLEKLSHDNYTINNIDITYISLITLTILIVSSLSWLVLRTLKEGRKALTDINKDKS